MWYEGGEGKKELGKPETIYMLQIRYDECTSDEERANPQQGIWIYERSPAMRRNFKRNYPEFFAKQADVRARQQRQQRHKEAEETIKDRKRRGRDTSEIPALRSQITDISTYRKQAGG